MRIGCKHCEVKRDVFVLLQSRGRCVSHKRDVLLSGEGNIEGIAVVCQREVVPNCNAMVCALEVVRSHKADVTDVVIRSLHLSGLRTCSIIGTGVTGCMSIAMCATRGTSRPS